MKMIKYLNKYILAFNYKMFLIILCSTIVCSQVNAGINNLYGFTLSNDPHTYCENYTRNGEYYYNHPYSITVFPTTCTYQSSSTYPPHSGYYRVKVSLVPYGNYFESSSFYLDATKSFTAQSVTMNGSGGTFSSLDSTVTTSLCYNLIEDNGDSYAMYGYANAGCTGKSLPTKPDVIDTSCKFNNGSDLSVSLGIIDRSELPTVPDSGSAKAVQIPVECTGGDVSFAMKVKYSNPISIGSSQAVSTTSNGVGVAVIYDNEPIATTDSKNIKFLQGSNTLTLNFQAVRDPTVEVEDIPTGAFTANAILEMTQQ